MSADPDSLRANQGSYFWSSGFVAEYLSDRQMHPHTSTNEGYAYSKAFSTQILRVGRGSATLGDVRRGRWVYTAMTEGFMHRKEEAKFEAVFAKNRFRLKFCERGIYVIRASTSGMSVAQARVSPSRKRMLTQATTAPSLPIADFI